MNIWSPKRRIRQSVFVIIAMAMLVPRAQSNEWRSVASMTSPRDTFTATKLNNGSVLVAGGHGLSGWLSSSEIYDPALGLWRETGSMVEPHHGHTATLLNDGRVLVVGGYVDHYTASVEVYDPSTESWTLIAPLSLARDRHTATRLLDGRVLVAGGFTANGATATVEVYDLSADTWTNYPEMPEKRAYQNAVLLSENRLLIAAGENRLNLSSNIIFDFDKMAWAATGTLSIPHAYGQTATVLTNGAVLIVGGEPNTSKPGTLALREVELYRPNTGQCAPAAKLGVPRYFHTATRLHNSRVFVAGGWSRREQSLPQASTEIYDLHDDRWIRMPPMSDARANHAAVLLDNGTVLVVGGIGRNGNKLETAEVFQV